MKSEKILNMFIIEDNVIYASALKQYLQTGLEKLNLHVVIKLFKNSESCLDWLNCYNSAQPDIIIMDYFLNDQFGYSMNGVAALFHLKILKPNLEVIFLSGQPNIEVAVESLRMGANDYVVKNDLAFPRVLDSVQECFREMKLNGKTLLETSGNNDGY